VADGFQVARHVGAKPMDRRRWLFQHLLERLKGRCAADGRPACQHLVENGAQPVHVGWRTDVLIAPRLFGGHVLGRAQHGAGVRQAGVSARGLGQAEIRDPRRPGAINQDVGRLEVAVDDALDVGEMNGPGEDLDQAGGVARRVELAAHLCSQRVAVDPLHRQVGPAAPLSHLVDANYVGVADLSSQLGLVTEADELFCRRQFGGQHHLQSDRPIERQVLRLVDNAHAAAADLLAHVVAGHARKLPCPINGLVGLGRRSRVDEGGANAIDPPCKLLVLGSEGD
jgi:hypothetical protein